jgi:hypothetical protein
MQQSMFVMQAIVDATGDAMAHGRGGATAADLVAAVLRSSVLSARPPVAISLDLPLARVVECADGAARARLQITDLSDILQCVLDECAGALLAYPEAKSTIESALAEARMRPRFASVMAEAREVFWRVESTRASGRRENQYFTTFDQAERERLGLPMSGPGIQVTSYCVTDEDETDPVVIKRVVPPGGK